MTLALAHIGIGVPDLGRALGFYASALACEVLHGPVTVPAGRQVRDVLGTGPFRQAHVRTPGGLVLELFEFAEPSAYDGLFHVCLLAPDLDERAAAIAAAGGRRLSRVWRHRPGAPSRLCYCADPFGNRIELSTHADEVVYAGRVGRAL